MRKAGLALLLLLAVSAVASAAEYYEEPDKDINTPPEQEYGHGKGSKKHDKEYESGYEQDPYYEGEYYPEHVGKWEEDDHEHKHVKHDKPPYGCVQQHCWDRKGCMHACLSGWSLLPPAPPELR